MPSPVTMSRRSQAAGRIRLTDAEMLQALEALKEQGGLPIVHAENHDVIMHQVARYLTAGHREPRWHPHTRPAAGEAEATQRALSLAEMVDLAAWSTDAAPGVRSVALSGLPYRAAGATASFAPLRNMR